MKIAGAKRIFFLEKLPHPGLGMAVSSFVLPVTEDLQILVIMLLYLWSILFTLPKTCSETDQVFSRRLKERKD